MADVSQFHGDLLADINATETMHGKAAFWWLGQHGFVVKAGETVIYIDPYFAENPTRQTRSPLSPEAVTNATICTGSHDHGDHIDPESIPGIAEASPDCKFIVPNPHVERAVVLGCARESVIGLRPGETAVVAGATITAVKAKHESFDETDLGFPHLGYIFEVNGTCFYHSGDTLVYEGLVSALERRRLDAMFVPINGRDAERFRAGCLGNMTYQEAVDLAGDLRPRLVVPTHYDMFESNPGDPRAFAAFLDAKFPEIPCWIGPVGEKVTFGGDWSRNDRTA
ncbi:MAG TPA: MBL fold metallo-hydrolase [Armatimonadota bacterium]|nr:MBL fold metallo-hydrolase [Armatimonadota bacterium]